MLQGLLIQIWMSCKRRRLTITGMSIHAFVRLLERIHHVHVIDRKNLQREYMWSGRRLTKIQTTTRPDYVGPEVWTKIGKAAQNREKQEWPKEKPKLDNARKLRGIYFIDPDDKEYSEIIKKRKKKTGKNRWLQPCLASETNSSLAS